MKGKKLLSMFLGTMLICSTTMLGCANKDNKTGKATNKMDKEQYLNVNLGAEPKTLDLGKATDGYANSVFGQIYESLTRCEVDKNGKDVIKPAAAKSWEHNKDATVWTFHLRDLKWSDGKPVKAEDFVYSMLRTLNPKTGSSTAFMLSPIKGADEYNAGKANVDAVGLKAIDDKTLQFTLKQPCPYFLKLTYASFMSPQRKDVVEKYNEKYGSDGESLGVYCGPFKLEKWAHQSQISLVKNDKYWDKKNVKLSKLNFKIITDQNAAYNSLYNGALDLGGVSKKEWIKKFDSTGKFFNVKGFEPSTNFTFFNQKDKVFSNAKVRQAFSLGITREDMANAIFKGRFVAAYGWCPPPVQINGDTFRKQVKIDPVKELGQKNPDPKKLLSEGLKELGMNPDPTKLTVTILESGTTQWDRNYAEYQQQMYKKTLGVNIKAEYVEWPVFQKRTNDFKYQIAGMAWGGFYNDPNTFFDMYMTGADSVPTGWSNKKYDDLVKQAMKSLDPKKRTEDYEQAEKILLETDAVIAPTEYRTHNTYIRKYVKGLMLPMFGDTQYKYAYTEGRSK